MPREKSLENSTVSRIAAPTVGNSFQLSSEEKILHGYITAKNASVKIDTKNKLIHAIHSLSKEKLMTALGKELTYKLVRMQGKGEAEKDILSTLWQKVPELLLIKEKSDKEDSILILEKIYNLTRNHKGSRQNNLRLLIQALKACQNLQEEDLKEEEIAVVKKIFKNFQKLNWVDEASKKISIPILGALPAFRPENRHSSSSTQTESLQNASQNTSASLLPEKDALTSESGAIARQATELESSVGMMEEPVNLDTAGFRENWLEPATALDKNEITIPGINTSDFVRTGTVSTDIPIPPADVIRNYISGKITLTQRISGAINALSKNDLNTERTADGVPLGNALTYKLWKINYKDESEMQMLNALWLKVPQCLFLKTSRRTIFYKICLNAVHSPQGAYATLLKNALIACNGLEYKEAVALRSKINKIIQYSQSIPLIRSALDNGEINIPGINLSAFMSKAPQASCSQETNTQRTASSSLLPLEGTSTTAPELIAVDNELEPLFRVEDFEATFTQNANPQTQAVQILQGYIKEEPVTQEEVMWAIHTISVAGLKDPTNFVVSLKDPTKEVSLGEALTQKLWKIKPRRDETLQMFSALWLKAPEFLFLKPNMTQDHTIFYLIYYTAGKFPWGWSASLLKNALIACNGLGSAEAKEYQGKIKTVLNNSQNIPIIRDALKNGEINIPYIDMSAFVSTAASASSSSQTDGVQAAGDSLLPAESTSALGSGAVALEDSELESLFRPEDLFEVAPPAIEGAFNPDTTDFTADFGDLSHDNFAQMLELDSLIEDNSSAMVLDSSMATQELEVTLNALFACVENNNPAFFKEKLDTIPLEGLWLLRRENEPLGIALSRVLLNKINENNQGTLEMFAALWGKDPFLLRESLDPNNNTAWHTICHSLQMNSLINSKDSRFQLLVLATKTHILIQSNKPVEEKQLLEEEMQSALTLLQSVGALALGLAKETLVSTPPLTSLYKHNKGKRAAEEEIDPSSSPVNKRHKR